MAKGLEFRVFESSGLGFPKTSRIMIFEGPVMMETQRVKKKLQIRHSSKCICMLTKTHVFIGEYNKPVCKMEPHIPL